MGAAGPGRAHRARRGRASDAHGAAREALQAARPVRALAALAETARAALLLRTVLELDYATIARLLDIPEGTAMSHVHRSREALRRALLAAREAERRSRP